MKRKHGMIKKREIGISIITETDDNTASRQSGKQVPSVGEPIRNDAPDKKVEMLIRRAIHTTLSVYRIRSGEVSVVLTDDKKIRRLNRQHRNTDRATDVLSFPQYHGLAEIKKTDYPYLGDIVISMETAEKQAEEYGHSLEREVAYLTVHSMLHLLGYDHLNEKDRFMMRFCEKEIMKTVGIFKSESQA